MTTDKSKQLFAEAQKYIPGGVNSPARAFGPVGGEPLFISGAAGAYLYDADGNQYIELINSWGPMILGHANPIVTEALQSAVTDGSSYGAPTEVETHMAKLVCELVPSIDQVRMVNSGTEATMSAIRVARGYTGRDKVVKFAGNYHGHGDSFLIAAGSGALTGGAPNSPGVTEGTARDTLLAHYNDLDSVGQLFTAYQNEVAAVIVEPVAGNMGCVGPAEGFLEGLRQLCTQHGAVLIFDEVMTGFRLAPGGAQARFGVVPDMTCLGKIIGGGLPVGAYGGRHEIMQTVAPVGQVYQAGTLSGNPLAMSAGLALLRHLAENPAVYDYLEDISASLGEAMQKNIDHLGLPCTINRVGSMMTLFFTEKEVIDLATAQASDTEKFGAYFRGMLHEGVYLAPSQFEALFISSVVGEDHIRHIATAQRKVLEKLS